VHSLKVESKSVLDLADRVFHDLARTRPTLEVLPNLRCLHWNTPEKTEHIVIFMHDKVTEFLFDYDSINSIPSLASNVLGRMPSLTSLEWTNRWWQDRKDIPSLLRLLSGLQKLQRITLPKYFLGDRLLKTLSLLPELKVVRFDTMSESGPFNPVIKGTLEEGAFPMLYDLCLCGALDDMRRYLTGGTLLPRLKNLSVGSFRRESPSTVQRFLADVTECYPALEVISFSVIGRQGCCKPLRRENLCPLVSLKQLTRLELRHDLPIQISEDDLAEFSAAFPTIETLVLNPEPRLPKKPRFTLSSLLFVAQKFPNLSHLGIYLDAEVRAPYSLVKIQTFSNLRTLNVGWSPIGADHVSVALFLSRLLSESEGVVIRSGVPLGEADYHYSEELEEYGDELEEEIDERRRRWQEIVKVLPPLLQLYKEEKTHRKEIEREVEDLRNEVLMWNMRVDEGSKLARVAN